MLASCPRCGRKTEYFSTLPERCPYCNYSPLIPEKSEEEILRDTNRMKLSKKLKNISPTSKKRRIWGIPLAIVNLILPVVVGIFLIREFSLITPKPEKFLHMLGGLMVLIGSYRALYHVVMGIRTCRAIKKGYLSVPALIVYLGLKTHSDVLIILRRLIFFGILHSISVKHANEIIK